MDQYLKYTLVAPKRPGNLVTFTFYLNGNLKSMEFNEDAEPQFIRRIGEFAPFHKKMLEGDAYQGCVITDMTELDLSFATFWNTYAVKVGNKNRVESKWNALTKEEQILALSHIHRYRRWSDKKGIEMCFPETYINGRRWEDQLPG